MVTRKKSRFLKFADRYESLLVMAIFVLMAAELTIMVFRP